VIVDLFTNREERLSPGTVLSVPGGALTVVRAARHQHRWIVCFAGVDSREAADALRGVVLSAEPLDDPDALWVHELVGASVVTVAGVPVGEVTGVWPNPAGDILEVAGSVLVPLRFVVSSTDGIVRIDPPEGLLEVND
jgi:16S rRNA processing protein RimM